MPVSYTHLEKYHIEDGNFTLEKKATDSQIKRLEKEGVQIYENYYVEEDADTDLDGKKDSTVRVYKNRSQIDLVCLLKGELPKKEDVYKRQDKARLILLNKSDLADEKSNEAWVALFEAKVYCVRKINSRSGAGLKSINAAVLEACHEKIERDKRKGIKNRPVRAMVVGIPNV